MIVPLFLFGPQYRSETYNLEPREKLLHKGISARDSTRVHCGSRSHRDTRRVGAVIESAKYR